MASCSLSFNFSKSADTVQAGGEFQGELVVKVDSACRCDGLTLAAEWRTSGKGNSTTGQAEPLSLFKGEWQPGEHRYRFTYKAPLGPLTYAGDFLQIQWALMARADIPWAIDPKVEAPFVLLPAEAENAPYFFGPLYKPPDPSTVGVSETAGGGKLVKKPMGLGVKIFIGAVALTIGGAIVVAVPFLALILAPFVLFFVIKNAMVKSKLGVPEVKVFPNPAHRGQELIVHALLNPPRDVKLGKVYVELVGRELVVSGSGKHQRTHTNVFHTFRFPFPFEHREVRAGETVDLRARITLPPNAPITFSAYSNNVQWNLQLSVELLGWPDWSKTFPLTVRPGVVTLPATSFARN